MLNSGLSDVNTPLLKQAKMANFCGQAVTCFELHACVTDGIRTVAQIIRLCSLEQHVPLGFGVRSSTLFDNVSERLVARIGARSEELKPVVVGS